MPLALTLGEPAGIGPEIALLAWEAIGALNVDLGDAVRALPANLISAALAAAVTLFVVIEFLTHNEARHWPAWIGLILGIVPDSPFLRGETTLAPGDLLVLYTDGVTEGADASHEQFGEERLVASIRAAGTIGASELAHRIVREVRAFEGESGPADDITVLVARRTDATA